MKKSSINLRVNGELRTYLDEMAHANNQSLSDFIRLILEEKMSNENELEEDYEILKLRAEKMEKALKDNDWIYIEGEYSTLEIQYDDFEVSTNIWKSDYSSNGNILIDLKLYKNSNLIFVSHFTKETRFEIRKNMGKDSLYITKF